MRSTVTLLLATLVMLATAGGNGSAAPTQRVELPDIIGATPATWKATPISEMAKRFRLVQMRTPKAAGDEADPELIVFYFGPGGGGGVTENVDRWQGMFEGPGGGAPKPAKTATTTRKGLRITTVDLSGTYKERASPMAPNYTPRPNYRMLAAAVETTAANGQGPYWLRLVGPTKSVTAQQTAWNAFLASLRTK
jgi:hypothetical protein